MIEYDEKIIELLKLPKGTEVLEHRYKSLKDLWKKTESIDYYYIDHKKGRCYAYLENEVYSEVETKDDK